MFNATENVTSVEVGVDSFEWLGRLETPFSWRPGDLLPSAERDDIVSHLISKSDYDMSKQKPFTFERFILQLVVSYELYASLKNDSAALNRLERIEQNLCNLDIISNNSFYRESRRAQWHLVLSSKACVLAFSGKSKESKAVISDSFDPVSALTSLEVGGLEGIKGAVFLQYGTKAASEALRLSHKAVQASPRQAEWHLLMGRAMESLRRSKRNFTGVPEEELMCLERAADLSPEPQYSLYLARAYERLVTEGLARHRNDPAFNGTELHERLLKLGRQATRVYQKVLRMSHNCMKTKINCLKSMLKLPRQFLHVAEIKTVLDEVANAPNISKTFYNVAGTFYLKMYKNTDTALRLFEQGETLRDYGSCINALRLRIKLHPDLDIEHYLLKLINQFREDPSSYEHALAHLGAFYIFRERNVCMAVDTFNKILAQNPRSKAVLAHQPMFLRSSRPINMLAVLVNEVRRAEAVPLVAPVDPQAQRRLWWTVVTHHPSLLKRHIDVYLVDKMLDTGHSKKKQHNNNKDYK